MEVWLRRLLLVCGYTIIILGTVIGLSDIWNSFTGLFGSHPNFLSGFGLIWFFLERLYYFISKILNQFYNLGIGLLCLYAAHTLAPLNPPFKRD